MSNERLNRVRGVSMNSSRSWSDVNVDDQSNSITLKNKICAIQNSTQEEKISEIIDEHNFQNEDLQSNYENGNW